MGTIYTFTVKFYEMYLEAEIPFLLNQLRGSINLVIIHQLILCDDTFYKCI